MAGLMSGLTLGLMSLEAGRAPAVQMMAWSHCTVLGLLYHMLSPHLQHAEHETPDRETAPCWVWR
jgi:hypothetical protein